MNRQMPVGQRTIGQKSRDIAEQCDQIGRNFAFWLLFTWAYFYIFSWSCFKTWFDILIFTLKAVVCWGFGLSIWAMIYWLQFWLHFQILGEFLLNFVVTLLLRYVFVVLAPTDTHFISFPPNGLLLYLWEAGIWQINNW